MSCVRHSSSVARLLEGLVIGARETIRTALKAMHAAEHFHCDPSAILKDVLDWGIPTASYVPISCHHSL